MSRKNPRNSSYIAAAKELLDHIGVEIDEIAEDARTLAANYQRDRAHFMETRADRPHHNGLSLTWKEAEIHDGLLTIGRIFWSRGRYMYNNKQAIAKRKKQTALTRKIHNCGDTGDYTKTNIKQALHAAEKWEVDLTWQYEQEAQKLREHLRDLSSIVSAIAWCSPRPDLTKR